jgi:DNA-binding transcriptional MerR regulator
MASAPDPKADPARARRTGKKSADAFRTISEVAQELDLPQHVLRFWETKFPQVKPMKRGGGRRYYRPDDILLLKRIRALLYDQGYTIKGARKLLKDKSAIETIEVGNGPAPGGDVSTSASAPAVAPFDMPAVPVDGAPRAEEPRPLEAEAAPAPGLGEAQRTELRAILAELEEIRALLKQGASD